MAQKKAKIEAEWDEELEKKIEEKAESWSKNCKIKNHGSHAGAGAVYGLGLIGAAIYYIQNAPTFWDGVVGLLKALVWPAYLVYKLLESFNM